MAATKRETLAAEVTRPMVVADASVPVCLAQCELPRMILCYENCRTCVQRLRESIFLANRFKLAPLTHA